MTPSDSHRLAALDNAALCAAMWRAHGLFVEEADGLIACSGEPPRFYPNAVTLDPGYDPEDQIRRIGERASRASGPYAVKDSYGVLGLDRIGFEPLFRASWIRRAAAEMAEAPRLQWRPVTDPLEELALWEQAWSGGADEPRVFPRAFLSSPGVTVLAGRAEGRIVAGCIVTDTGPSAGVSNIFGNAAEVFRACARAFSGRDLVGYERGEALAEALAAGFEIVGELTVWRR